MAIDDVVTQPTGGKVSEGWRGRLNGVELRVGAGALSELGALVHAEGVERPLLVTDRGIVEAGHAERIQRLLERAGLRVTLFDEVVINPTESVVARGAVVASDADIDSIIAVGGGSVMDAAKGVNFVLTNGGRMRDYQGYGRTRQPLLPSLGVPTTAGTGSDAQTYALISHDETHAKMACGAADAGFRAVVLDPGMLASVPADVMAIAAIDAVSHAIESFVSRSSHPLSRLYAAEAWRLLQIRWKDVVDPAAADDAARTDLLWSAHLAGAAIEQSMLGAAHGCANPLTAHADVVHGVAVGLMLPHVVRFNTQPGNDPYTALDARGGATLATALERLRGEVGLPERLRECNVPQKLIPRLAEDAVVQWTSKHNPRPLGLAEAVDLYEAAY